MESVGKQRVVQVEKTGIKFYDQDGEKIEVASDVTLQPFAVISDDGTAVFNLDKEVIQLGEVLKVEISSVAFSPKKSYVIACSKFIEGQSNLFILNTKMEVVADFVWKSSSKEGAISVSWTNDEKYMARRESTSAKKLYIYEVSESLSIEFGTITQDKVTSFAFSPHGSDEEKPYFLVVGACGETSSLTKFYQMKTLEKEKFKSLSKGGQEINYVFAPNGHAVIIWTQHVVDTTGQSYYGNHDLRYVQLGGGNKRSKIAVFDNQVSDVAWSPDSEDFIVISGKQPAVCTLYSKNCVPTFEFGRIHLNTIRYSPFSNLVLLGGFGNLVGDIQIWNKDSLSLIGKNKAHCATICEWSPDGSQILTAVTHPRVRVDNEVKIFNYYGKKTQHRQIPKDDALYNALWQPCEFVGFTKIEIPEGFKAYVADDDPEEKVAKPQTTAKKGVLNLPKSSAFGDMLRAEMNAVCVQGPRKLKKDDYKEFLMETPEEKKALTEKPEVKVEPKTSWRTNQGFKIPPKEEKKEITTTPAQPQLEEMKLVPAPQEYKMPAKPQENGAQNKQKGNPSNQNQTQNQNQNKNKNKNKNKKNKEKKKANDKSQSDNYPPMAYPSGGYPAQTNYGGGGGEEWDYGGYYNDQENTEDYYYEY